MSRSSVTRERHQSVWQATVPARDFPQLVQNAATDVCVIGAGIAGLSTAYLLARSGKSVVVLDDGPIADGMTGVTTAHLTHVIDDRYFQIEKLHGQEGARLAAESHTAAIDRIEAIVAGKGSLAISNDLTAGCSWPRAGSRDSGSGARGAHRAGLRRAESAAQLPIAGFNPGPCLRFPDQASSTLSSTSEG